MFQNLMLKKFRAQRQNGFTLLELVVVITVMLILSTLAVPMFMTMLQNAKDVTLKDSLFKMRDAIDKYTLDKEEAPPTLDSLVEANYIREVPTDPITGGKDWEVEMEEEPVSKNGKRGIKNVFSGAPGTSANGVPYKDF
jgi:general secretion pathway protein G